MAVPHESTVREYGTVHALIFLKSIVRLFCNGTGTDVATVRFKNWTEVRNAGTVRFKVQGT